jgi:hypothetical protein
LKLQKATYSQLAGVDGARAISVEEIEGLLQFRDFLLTETGTLELRLVGFGLSISRTMKTAMMSAQLH